MGISGRPPFRLTTLGGLALAGDAGPLAGAAAQRRSLALLALLALGRNKGVSRDKLVVYLWPESGEERAHHELVRSEEHTSELQSHHDLVCRLLLEKKKKKENI